MYKVLKPKNQIAYIMYKWNRSVVPYPAQVLNQRARPVKIPLVRLSLEW